METKIEKHIVSGSSTITRIDYDHLMENMKVYFKAGDVYVYTGVPYNIFTEMKEAESAGRFLHTNVRNVYDFMKVTTKIKGKKDEQT